MDNNMTAIVSVIMIGLGFLNGMIVTTALDKYEVSRLHARIVDALDDHALLQRRIDRLKEELEEEREEKEDLLRKLRVLVSQYTHLPPPEGPLQRSRVCSDIDSDSESFKCPTSPSLNQSNKD